MDILENIIDNQRLVNDNLRGIHELQRIESDGELLHKSDASSLSKHNEHYTELLEAYVSDFRCNSQNKRKNKEELFIIAKRLLVWIPVITIVFMFVTLVFLILDKISVLESLPGLFTALASLIGTFMVVPQMITEYLFNKEEENHLAEIISKIQEYDRDIRGGL